MSNLSSLDKTDLFIIEELYNRTAIHLCYPPTHLQIYEDYVDEYEKEFIYYVQTHEKYADYGASTFNEFIEGIQRGSYGKPKITADEFFQILKFLRLQLYETKAGVW